MSTRSFSSMIHIFLLACSTQVTSFFLSETHFLKTAPHFLKNKEANSFICGSWSQWVEIHPSESDGTDAFVLHNIDSNPEWASPRTWLEALQVDEGGVYSVLRCDYRCQDGEWKIWGLDFHLQRLRDSFSRSHRFGVSGSLNNKERQEYQTALHRSQRMINILLENIKTSLLTTEETNSSSQFTPRSLWAVTVVVTFLWQTRPGREGIAVTGHCFSTGTSANLLEAFPEAIVASVALVPERSMVSSQSALPNRFSVIPEAKLASWIQRRRPLENDFQATNAGEVLLVRPLDDKANGVDNYEILEGLTSNVFFVYPGGLLRTASSGVLLGYGRHMVLETAASCKGVQVDFSGTPITLDDAAVWQEVFLTSSIKLITPVSKILIPSQRDNNSEEIVWKQVWSAPINRRDDEAPFWQKIRAILIRYVHYSLIIGDS